MNTITFDKKITSEILKILEFEVNDAGIICDKFGHYIPSITDSPAVHVNDFVGAIKTEAGPRLITKNITDLIILSDCIDGKKIEEVK
jgi:hypothetical protein